MVTDETIEEAGKSEELWRELQVIVEQHLGVEITDTLERDEQWRA